MKICDEFPSSLSRVVSAAVVEALKAYGHDKVSNVVPVKMCKFQDENDPRSGKSTAKTEYTEVGTDDIITAILNYLDSVEGSLYMDGDVKKIITTFLLVCRGFTAKGYTANYESMISFSPYLRKAKPYEDEEERKLCAEAHLTGDWKILDSKAERYVSEGYDAMQKRRRRATLRAERAEREERAEGRVTKVRCPNCGTMVTIENTMDCVRD